MNAQGIYKKNCAEKINGDCTYDRVTGGRYAYRCNGQGGYHGWVVTAAQYKAGMVQQGTLSSCGGFVWGAQSML